MQEIQTKKVEKSRFWHFLPGTTNKIIHRLSKVNSSLEDLACDDLCKSKHAYCIHLKLKAVSRHVVNVASHLEAYTKMGKTNHMKLRWAMMRVAIKLQFFDY